VWLGEFWLTLYNVPDYAVEARRVRRLLRFHPASLVTAAVLILIAWFYKKHFAIPEDQAGFPGYFTLSVDPIVISCKFNFTCAQHDHCNGCGASCGWRQH
jgi:hypothetical protein